MESELLHVGGGKYTISLNKGISKKDVDQWIDSVLKGSVPDLSGYFNPPIHEFNKYSDGRLVIPGATIKGMVRTRLELSIPDSCYVVNRQSNYSSPRYINIFRPAFRRYYHKFPQVCVVDDLLGTAKLASRVNFTDFVGSNVKVKKVNINNEDYECAEKGSTFTGKVLFRSIRRPEEIGMLLYGFGFRLVNGKLQQKIQLLGRFKYIDKRFGRVSFSIRSSSLTGGKIDLSQALQKFVSSYRPRDFNEAW